MSLRQVRLGDGRCQGHVGNVKLAGFTLCIHLLFEWLYNHHVPSVSFESIKIF